jgi:hypothetical protein
MIQEELFGFIEVISAGHVKEEQYFPQQSQNGCKEQVIVPDLGIAFPRFLNLSLLT